MSKVPVNETIIYDRVGQIAHIRLNRPEKLNAYSDDMAVALGDAYRRFDDDDDAFVAILSGNGRAFCSGADVQQRQLRPLEEMRRLGGPAGVKQPRLHEMRSSKPVIAAVHGYALGAGLAIMTECDLTVVTEDTVLQITEVARGVWGEGMWRRLQVGGAGRFADDVAITGRRFSGREAWEQGAVTRVVGPREHMAGAEKLAFEVLESPPLAVRAVVKARRWYNAEAERLSPLFHDGAPLHLTDDFRESALAFVEKRPHKPWAGR
jgi:enoyl-CoA hydratase/carnithine racemase